MASCVFKLEGGRVSAWVYSIKSICIIVAHVTCTVNCASKSTQILLQLKKAGQKRIFVYIFSIFFGQGTHLCFILK
jgi:hypothetical protein